MLLFASVTIAGGVSIAGVAIEDIRTVGVAIAGVTGVAITSAV